MLTRVGTKLFTGLIFLPRAGWNTTMLLTLEYGRNRIIKHKWCLKLDNHKIEKASIPWLSKAIISLSIIQSNVHKILLSYVTMVISTIYQLMHGYKTRLKSNSGHLLMYDFTLIYKWELQLTQREIGWQLQAYYRTGYCHSWATHIRTNQSYAQMMLYPIYY